MRRLLLPFVLLAACKSSKPTASFPPPQPPPGWVFPFDVKPTHTATAMVVSEAPDATRAGVDAMKAGGNAIDGAVAVAFALAVVFPEAGNLGGGGFAVVRTAGGEVAALDFREMAPGRASRDMYLDASGKPTEDSRIGPRASGVPGSVAGLAELHEKYGKRPWAELVAPAIALAEGGFVVDERLAERILDYREQLERFPTTAALFFPGGEPLAAGATLRQPELAATLRRIAEKGAAGFYEGPTADLFATEMERSGGLISREDLRAYKAVWRAPIAFSYRGYKLWSMPPPSSGGITLMLIAGMLERYDLRALGWGSWQHLHLFTEALRRAFADRNTYLGDPDFTVIPAGLLAPGYAAQRGVDIDPEKATPSAETHGGLKEGNHTTHFNVVDAEGNAVALTTTLNELFGSAVMVTGAGFFLNDEMDDFTAKVGEANLFGLVQGASNSIAPGKRPLSAMSPTIVVGPDGKLRMLAGGRGGPRIISATWQVLSNVIDFGMGPAAAVSAPRIHHQHLPDELMFEQGGVRPDVQQALKDRGYKLTERGKAMAITQLIVRDGDGWAAFPDPRRGGLAAGF